MDDLIARVLSSEAGEFERRRLEEWRRESADNERRYRELAGVWALSAPADPPRPAGAPPSVGAIVAEAERRRAASPALPSRRARWVRWWLPLAAAAGLTLVVGIPRFLPAPDREYATGPEQTLTVPLADGSVVRLGPSSSLRVSRTRVRRAHLDGRAFFAVAPDPEHPFVIRTERGDVRVLGTRFDLVSRADSLRLVVVEGRVRLSGRGGEVEVSRGGVASIAGSAAPTLSFIADLGDLLEWPGGLLVFQGTPLSRVMEEIGEHFGRPVVFRDPSLSSLTVTAWFENEPIEEVVSTVCLVVGASCTVRDTVEVGR